MNSANGDPTEAVIVERFASTELRVAECALVMSRDERAIGLLEDLLERNDSRVIACTDVDQATDLYHLERPALVIADVGACGRRCREFIQDVKGTDDSVPVILLATETELEAAIEGVEEGAYDYIEKPIRVKVLMLAIRRALQYRGFVRFKRATSVCWRKRLKRKLLKCPGARIFSKASWTTRPLCL